MTLTDDLSAVVGACFVAEGMDAPLGRVRISDRPDLAHFQCNGAMAAKKLGKEPRAVAEAIAKILSADDRLAAVNVAGPGFINLTLSDSYLSAILEEMRSDEQLGGGMRPKSSRVVMDYGGPNVAKPLHVGHLRAAIIGEALKRLFRFVGDEVTSDIHLGDWGLQMGQLISELESREPGLVYFQEGNNAPYPNQPPIELADLEEMYPVASAACKSDPERAELARIATKALQDGHEGYRALWRHFVMLSVDAMRVNYQDLGVEFDLWKGEADADALIPDMLVDLDKKGLVELSDGAKIVRVARDQDKKEMPPVILVNSKGAVGYHTTDVATILDRKISLDPHIVLYVVDNRQSLHFEQVFRVSGMADYIPEDRLEHLSFGTMQGKDGKPFKTRDGGVLKLRDLIDMVAAKAQERIDESGFAEGLSRDEIQEVAQKVGIAALKFADLANQRTTDYIFDIDRFTSFEGKTGPYLLYASVRVKSVLAKSTAVNFEPGPIAVNQDAERNLALVLASFGDVVRQAYEKRMPHFLCEHAFSLAQAISKFYASCRIADESDERVRGSRISLTELAGNQLNSVLDILGMDVPDRM